MTVAVSRRVQSWAFLALLLSSIPTQAEVLEGYVDFGLADNITVRVMIDTTADIVDIVMTGPASRWWGVGFGNHEMSGTYSIIAREDDSSVEEYILESRSAGYHIDPAEISVSADDIDGSTRTVTVTRNRVGNSYEVEDSVFKESYTFPVNEVSIVLIAGYAPDTQVPDNFLGGSGFMGGHSDESDPPRVFVQAEMCFTVPIPKDAPTAPQKAVNFCL